MLIIASPTEVAPEWRDADVGLLAPCPRRGAPAFRPARRGGRGERRSVDSRNAANYRSGRPASRRAANAAPSANVRDRAENAPGAGRRGTLGRGPAVAAANRRTT